MTVGMSLTNRQFYLNFLSLRIAGEPDKQVGSSVVFDVYHRILCVLVQLARTFSESGW